MSVETDILTMAQWIVQDGTVGLQAAKDGDLATCISCLDAVILYARGIVKYLPPRPDETSQP
jgi:hypothetical protein